MKAGVLTGVRRGKLRAMSAPGFTIFETMIVLAITSALFVVIAATVSGRQNAAEFIRGVQAARTDIQQIIDQEAAGYFPQQTFTCTAGASGPSFSAGGNTQGTNDPCIFLGKVIQFGVPLANPGDNEQYQIFTVAGLRSPTTAVGSPFAGSMPAVVGVNGDYATYSLPHTLQFGIKALWVRTNNSSIGGAVGFLMEPGSVSTASNNGYASGTQSIDLVGVPSTPMYQPIGTMATNITSNLRGGAPIINPVSGVQVCLVSGGTNQSGLITIGQTGRKLLVSLDVRSNKTCS